MPKPGENPENPNPKPDNDQDEKQFPESVVKDLRNEAAAARVAKREAEQKLEEMGTELSDLKKKISAIDLDELAALRTEKAEAEKLKKEEERKRLEEKGEYDKLLELTRTEGDTKLTALQEQLEAKLQEVNNTADGYKQQLEDMQRKQREAAVNSAIVTAASKAEAIDPEDIQLRVERVATLQEIDGVETVIIMGTDGEPMRTPAGKLMTVTDYVDGMRGSEKTAHLFKGSKRGAESNTAQTPQGSAVTNPWMSGSENVTEQCKIYRKNPAEAKRLMAEAGVSLDF